MKLIYLSILSQLTILFCQVTPYSEPLSKEYSIDKKSYNINEIVNNEFELLCEDVALNKQLCQVNITFDKEDYYNIAFSIDNININDKFYISNDRKDIIGPYRVNNRTKFNTNPIFGNSITIEINKSTYLNNLPVKLTIHNYSSIQNKIDLNDNEHYYIKNTLREEPVILVTGYWPPTNEMVRHFSQNTSLNPQGWQGDNWENRGYDIISYFPEFSNPDCSSCGQGYGDLEVDYQDTSEDFWPIFNNHNPIGIITFSRGYIDQSWELEYNAYNRTNWYNDFMPPFLPTPNPPDSNEVNFFLRNSNLPMNNIIDAINDLNIGLNPYIDLNGDPGHYVSEFMAYHGTWYRDLNQFGENNCISAGHIHVGGNISWDNAKIATEESIRTLINYIDTFIYTPGDTNQDAIIDILDLVLIINYILGDIDFSNIQTYSADINEDSNINIQDVILLINIILNNN